MQKYFLILFGSCLMLSGQTKETPRGSDNPFFNTFNQPIDFAAINGDDVNEATTEIEAYYNFIQIRNILLKEKEKYDVLIIDGLSDLDRYFLTSFVS